MNKESAGRSHFGLRFLLIVGIALILHGALLSPSVTAQTVFLGVKPRCVS
jgi:hypothetical protein